MPDRSLRDGAPGAVAAPELLQEVVEAETGRGEQGVLRTWQASDSSRVVLTSDASGVKISRDNGASAPAQVIVDGTAAGGQLSGTYPNPSLSVVTVDALIPPGTIWAYGGIAAPTGWLLCNGSVVPRATYPKLFAVVTTSYNTGGEAGTDFRLPDLRGRVPLGVGGAHALGSVGGSETASGPAHTHPGSHSHGLNGHTHAGAGHTHSMQLHVHGLNGHAHSLNGHQHSVDLAHGHTASAGGGTGTTDHVPVGAVGDPNHVRDTHAHAITVNGLGTTSTTVAASGTATTGTDSSNSGVSSATDTGGATAGATGVPSPTTDTATDASAPTSSYGAVTVPTMPPYQTVQFIVKTGA